MSITATLTHSADAWRLLSGLVCLYKPAGYSGGKLVQMLKYNLIDELNRMQRIVQSEGRQELEGGSGQKHMQLAGGGSQVAVRKGGGDIEANGSACVDYSVHPRVLGPGYCVDDLHVRSVNKLSEAVSGVQVIGLQRGGSSLVGRMQRERVFTTLHVRGEWGRATSTGWAGGKTRMCKGWRHLDGRPWLVDQCLATVEASHQASAWSVAGVGLVTQDAYNEACKGPVKPDMISTTLVYSIKVKEWNPPHFMMEVVCMEQLDDGQKYIVQLVEEIGLQCKTVAHTHSIRCAAVGPYTSNESLLLKHLNLQHVLDNISDNRKLFKNTLGMKKQSNITGYKTEKKSEIHGSDLTNAVPSKPFSRLI